MLGALARSIFAAASLFSAVSLTAGCSGGGDSNSSPAPDSSSKFVDTISSTNLATNASFGSVTQYSYAPEGSGFTVSPGSVFPGVFRVPIITDGGSNPRSITFSTKNTPGTHACISSITFPDGRIITLTRELVQQVSWPSQASPEFFVLADCGYVGGSTVILVPTSSPQVKSLRTPNCENQGGFVSFLNFPNQFLGGCVSRFPSSASSSNQANPTTNGFYLFTVRNLDSSQISIAPQVIVNSISHDLAEVDRVPQTTLNVELTFCGVPNLNLVTSHPTLGLGTVQHTNAFWLGWATHLAFNRVLSGTILAGLINEVEWPTESNGQIRYRACNAADAIRYANIDKDSRDFESLNDSYRPSQPGTVRVWIVNSITSADSPFIAGFSPSPGIPYVVGTGASGLLVEHPFDSTGNATDEGLLVIGNVVAHEIGHFLGLHHTTEFGGSTDGLTNADYLPETPWCTPAIMNTAIDLCPDRSNIMFPIVPNLGLQAAYDSSQRSPATSNPLNR